MATASLSLGTIVPVHKSTEVNSKLIPAAIQFKNSSLSLCLKRIPTHHGHKSRSPRRFTIFAVTEGSAKSSNSEEKIPSWAKPNSEEPPPWAQDEGKESLQQTLEVPFYVYLIASAITAIAAIGSVFEYINEKPVFGVLNPDNIFYAPLLGFFAFTGVPTSAFLWFKSVEAANKAAEEQDRKDGYR
ncbi:Transmembrane protein [Thalictrum thalictroides]|uniref:Transmembrane protein n=1 Tax=Thalictrum thalictroides TaxID=46969 RepID=A0A7J6X520_THATH|nr:Transmembrane protein [Thalictrum thalictroides]